MIQTRKLLTESDLLFACAELERLDYKGTAWTKQVKSSNAAI